MNRTTHTAFHPIRRIVILALVLMAMTCVAGAAFYPRIITWFADQYGQQWGAWMEKGSVALPASSAEAEGAVFTIDEVLVRGRGLYVLGRIEAQPGYVLIDQECSPDEPFGYNIHYGETAPEGTPTIAQKAAAEQLTMRYVNCDLNSIGVNGGALLLPGSWGYGARVQPDGSIIFSMEVEDGVVVEPGREYTLALQANSYGTHADGSIDLDALTEKAWCVTVVPEAFEATEEPDISAPAADEASPALQDASAAGPKVTVPEEYTRTGTLPVYRAVERDFTAIVRPEWFNASGIASRTEGKNHYVCVRFQDDAQLEWDRNSMYYNAYHGTVDVPNIYENGQTVMVTQPKPTIANAAYTLASWMTFGWPDTNEVYALEQQSLTGISLEEAKQRTEALFAQLGMDGYICHEALDMSVARIREMGARWNELIDSGMMYSNPRLDYTLATTDDEGYFLTYGRNGTDSELGGMFRASVYVTAKGFACINICDYYRNGDVCATPEKLISWETVAAALPGDLAVARNPLTLDEILEVQLVWCPVRAENAKDGMVLTPVWVLSFNAHDDEQTYEHMNAVYDAINSRLISGNWI